MLKESLKNRAQLLRDLETRGKDLKNAQEALSKCNSERADLTSNHQDLKAQVKTLQTALKKANNEDGVRADAKMAHKKDMARIQIRGEQLANTRKNRDKGKRVKLGFTEKSKHMKTP